MNPTSNRVAEKEGKLRQEINDILIELTDAMGFNNSKEQSEAFHKAFSKLVELYE